MKKRMRKFDQGGYSEDEDKAEGLRQSAGEKVGLLERLRMGNIDDPNSEAYRRFGAGRARIGRQLAPAAYKDTAPNMEGFDVPAAEAPDALEEADKRYRKEPISVPAGPRAPMAAPAAASTARPSVAPAARPIARPPAAPAAPMGAGAGRGVVNPSVADLKAATAVSKPAGRAEIPGAGPYKAPAASGNIPGELERNVRNTIGALAGLGGAAGAGAGLRGLLGGEKAATSGSRALATSETPVTFLGRSGARNVTPAERIGTSPKALPGPKGAEEAADVGTKAVGLSKESVNRAAAKKVAEGPARSKSEKELLESTLRGKAGRAEIAAKRAGPKKSETSASGKSSAGPRSKTKYDEDMAGTEFRRGGKAFAKGGHVSSASSRGDGIASRGKTRGRIY